MTGNVAIGADDDAPRAQLVVIGSGAAGLMAACVASDTVDTLLVTDRGIGTSNSAVAQGGLQLPDPDPDALRRFRTDIEQSGGPSVDPDRLDHFVASVRPTVALLQEWGLVLDRDAAGDLVKRIAGGMSEARVVTAGDRIGTAILRVLRDRVATLGVPVLTQHPIHDITTDDGGFVLHGRDGLRLRAQALVVAVGGGAYEHAAVTGEPTSNPPNRNTTLAAAIRRLGVPEIDPDLFQYQPYGIVDPDGTVSGKCVPESVVELGARVVDASGRPVAPAGSDRRTLTTAMFATLASPAAERSGDRPVVRLTLGSVDAGELSSRYPHLTRVYDRARLPNGDVHVVPVLHYQLGGFVVGPDGSTDVPGLYLAGEMTGGLHGRNRLMGNGITEAVVDGRVAGLAAARYLRSPGPAAG